MGDSFEESDWVRFEYNMYIWGERLLNHNMARLAHCITVSLDVVVVDD